MKNDSVTVKIEVDTSEALAALDVVERRAKHLRRLTLWSVYRPAFWGYLLGVASGVAGRVFL